MASPQSRPAKYNSFIFESSAITRTRNRSKTTANAPKKPTIKEVKPETLGFKISKEKLLLVKARAPDYYRIEMTDPSPCKLELSCEFPQIEITPKVLHFTTHSFSFEVTVYTRSMIGLSEVNLIHAFSEHDPVTSFFKLPMYVLDPSSVGCYSAGKDSQGQLAHLVTIERYLATHVHNSLSAPNANLLKDPTPRPIQVEPPIDDHWKSIAAGETHGLAVTVRGDVYSWGTGFYGQLGFTSQEQAIIQTRILTNHKATGLKIETQRYSFEDKTQNDYKGLLEDYSYESLQTPMLPAASRLSSIPPITQIACGLFHSLLLSSSMTVYSFGLGQNGRLGLGSEKNCATPEIVVSLKGTPVSEIAAGYHCSFFLISDSTVLSCGLAGASGHPEDKVLPTPISFLSEVHSISSALSHSGAVTYSGSCVLFGENTFGKICGPSPNVLDPASIGNRKVRAVYCGAKCTMFLTEDLEVFAVGSNDQGQLGLSSTNFQCVNQPIHVDFLSGRGVCELALGQEHSAAITVNGMLYTWGSNRKGQLGIGTMAKEFKRVGLPRLCDAFLGSPVTLVKASRSCTYFLTAAQHPEFNSSIFVQWKRSLILEEKEIQKRANYRYTLLKREIDHQELVKRVQEERSSSIGLRTPPSSVPKPPKKAAGDDYYSFWNEENETEQMTDGRVLAKFKKPSYYNDKRTRVVTIFPAHKRKAEGEEQTTALDIQQHTLNISTASGSKPVHVRLADNLKPSSSRPVYYERMQYEPLYRHTPSLLTSNMFYPYELVSNPMLLEPRRRA